jgi:hypothetical protein
MIPSATGSGPVDSYNTGLGLCSIMDTASTQIVANNAGLFRALQRLSPDAPPTFANINRLFAHAIVQVMSPLRWPSDSGYDSLGAFADQLRPSWGADQSPNCCLYAIPSIAVGSSMDTLAADLLHPHHMLLDVHNAGQHAALAEAAASSEARDAAMARALSGQHKHRPYKAVLHAERAVWAAGAVLCAGGSGWTASTMDPVLDAVAAEAAARWSPSCTGGFMVALRYLSVCAVVVLTTVCPHRRVLCRSRCAWFRNTRLRWVAMQPAVQ